jgi:hypothetical protein
MTAVLLVSADLAAIVSAVVAAVLWYRAGTRGLRRMSKEEEFDFHDFNRVITAFNRAAILNKRAAIASAVSALFVALRFLLDMLGIGG